MLFFTLVLMTMVFFMKRIGRINGIALVGGYIVFVAWLAGNA